MCFNRDAQAPRPFTWFKGSINFGMETACNVVDVVVVGGVVVLVVAVTEERRGVCSTSWHTFVGVGFSRDRWYLWINNHGGSFGNCG